MALNEQMAIRSAQEILAFNWVKAFEWNVLIINAKVVSPIIPLTTGH